jgi:hypothetical protein
MAQTNLTPAANPVSPGARSAAEDDLATFRAIVNMLIADPAKLRAATINAGIYTPTGELTRPFGGHG